MSMSLRDPSLATGVQYHQSGRLEEAQQMYRQVVAADPQNADAWSLLGAVCINLNRLDEAAEHLAEAIRIYPDHHAAHDNLGVLLARQGRYVEAVASFRRALAIRPDQASTHLNLAEAHARLGQTEEAIASWRRVVALAPDLFKAQSELAQTLSDLGRFAEAAPHWQQAARLAPADARVRFEFAGSLAQIGRLADAQTEYREVLRLNPNSAEACVNLGGVCIRRNELDEAIALFHRAIQLRPRFAEAYLNLGCALTRQQRTVEAIDALSQAIAFKPELTEAYNNLGIAQAAEARFAEATESYRQALALRPDNADAMYNLGIALLKQKMVASALDHFEQALELRADYAEARHNRSAALLMSENFDEGFAEYEWRFRSRDYGAFQARWPLWNGEPLTGRTIVLVAEQGLGDTLQFVRYATLLKQQAARVIVECQGSLHAVLARTPGVDEWITRDMPAPAADFCVPLLSLPYRMRTNHATIPADVPYVFADPERMASWRARLAGEAGCKIGVAWQGNPNYPEDRWRSFRLTQFEPLANLPGVRLVSLQKGPGSEQVAAVRQQWPIIDFGNELDAAGGAFVDTAAIMMNLDLVVTSDSATAHLAGALGVPVWVALPFVPDWRWLLERDDCPWYPTMRLFRQSQWGQWSDVFEQIAATAAALVKPR